MPMVNLTFVRDINDNKKKSQFFFLLFLPAVVVDSPEIKDNDW